MQIREATDHEIEVILNQSVQVLQEATFGYVNLSVEKALQMVSTSLADGGYYLVYVEDDVICGWIGVGKSYDFFTDQMVGVIPELYVLRKYRQHGVAEKLCKEAFQRLKQAGYDKVLANIFSGNHVKHLAKKLGFNEVYTMLEKEL